MNSKSPEETHSTTDLSKPTYSAGSTCSNYSWIKRKKKNQKAANTKPLLAPVETWGFGGGHLLAKLHSKCRSKDQDWEWHHNPTRCNYARQELPPPARAKVTSAQEGSKPSAQRTPGLQPRFEPGPPPIRETAASTKPTPKSPNHGTTWWTQWHLLSQAEQQRAQGSKGRGNHRTAVGAAMVKPQFPGYSGTAGAPSAGMPGLEGTL